MATRSLVIAAVGAVSALSIGAGTYLAFRAGTRPDTVLASPVEGTPAVTIQPAGAPSPPASKPPAAATRKEPRRAPSTATSAAPAVAAPTPASAAALPPVEPPSPPVGTPVVEPPVVQEPPKPQYDELTVKEDSVIGIRIDQTVTSETARVEDRVTARISRDVTVDGRTAIPAGARLEGVVTLAERGGKLRERAKLGIKFSTLILSDGLRVPIQTDTIFREGEAPAGEASSKIGAGAVVGAILGAVIGGKKGAILGSTAGAAGGTAAVMAGSRNEAAFASGAPLTVRLMTPVAIMIERNLVLR